MTVKLDAKAREWVVKKRYDPVFGVRPLKRFLQRHVETKLARALIASEVAEGSLHILFAAGPGTPLSSYLPLSQRFEGSSYRKRGMQFFKSHSARCW